MSKKPANWPFDTIQPPAEGAWRRAEKRQRILTKPPGSLGMLETLAIQLAAMQNSDQPAAGELHISVFAADHGIARQGVSAYPQEVTGQMLANFVNGGAAISALAKSLHATLEIVDVGILRASGLADVIDARAGEGTADFSQRDAMTPVQMKIALQAGFDAAERAAMAAAHVFIGGEMGIGNTSSATALGCAFLQQPASYLVGPGSGLDDDAVMRKAELIDSALARHADDEMTPLDILRAYGGFEIVALAGAFIRCAQRRLPILVDGFICTAAALGAVHINPGARDWMLFGHQSAEPGHELMLYALDAEPILNLDMRLGEGSGAACAAGLLRMACALHNNMATFEDAGVTDRT